MTNITTELFTPRTNLTTTLTLTLIIIIIIIIITTTLIILTILAKGQSRITMSKRTQEHSQVSPSKKIITRTSHKMGTTIHDRHWL